MSGWSHTPSTIRSPGPMVASCAPYAMPGNFIAKLPKREHDTFAWRAAIEALMLVAEHGGDTMLPRIGMMQALHPGDTTPRRSKKAAKKYRIVR
jgi:hypothetical protein